jgi:hypothetical protein
LIPALVAAALLWLWPAGVWAQAVADAGEAGVDGDAGQGGLELRADPLWEYDLPAGWTAEGAIIEGTLEGGTLLAATIGEGPQRRCVAVRLQRGGDGWQVWGYPYERAQRPTVCGAVESRPGGGFFLRAHGDSMLEGRADGFVTSITSEGQQAWYIDDGPVAEADAFVGSYDRPGSTLIYSRSADLLLSTTIAAFAPLMSPRRDVTHFSVLRDGAYRVDALTIGTDAMFGRLADTIVRGSDGTFWFVVTRPDSTQGANFFHYDGRQNLERRQVLEGEWDERFVKAIESGPDGTLYVLWRESAEASAPGHLAALEGEALEPRWQRTYEDAAEGIPVDVVAAPNGLVVLYRHASGDSIVRLDREDGGVQDVLDVGAVTSREVPTLLEGPQGGVKLLGYDPVRNNMREWAIRWNEPGGDDGSDNPGASGCHTLESAEGPPPGGSTLMWAAVVVAVACRRSARYNK